MTTTESAARLPDELPRDPMPIAGQWLQDAASLPGLRNPNAMTLVTVDGSGQPSARIVLCKAFVPDPGYLVFFTNYESRKGRELEQNPRVAVVFHWDAVGRQVRIEGDAVRAPAADSDAYFASRAWGSQLGAWGSDQSRPIESRAALVGQVRERATRLGIELGTDTTTLAGGTPPPIARPPHWGGYRLYARQVELWTEGSDRIHDRARWTRTLTANGPHVFSGSDWRATRLQP